MSEIFELVSKEPEQVVIKVKELDNLMIAKHPYIDSSYDYINVTRGRQNVLTVIKKDGTTWNFEWGYYSNTLIGGSTERLRWAVIDFVENECQISLTQRD